MVEATIIVSKQLYLLFYLSSKTYNLWLVISWVIGLRHHVHGLENQVIDGPKILVVNHQSALDVPGKFGIFILILTSSSLRLAETLNVCC